MFPGSFINEKKDALGQYEWRGEEYLSWSDEGVDSDQQVKKSQVDQVLHKAYHEFLEAFESDKVMVGQPKWLEWKVFTVNINRWPTQDLDK